MPVPLDPTPEEKQLTDESEKVNDDLLKQEERLRELREQETLLKAAFAKEDE